MHRSSISRELTLNTDDDGTYRGASAHKKYLARKKAASVGSERAAAACRPQVERFLVSGTDRGSLEEGGHPGSEKLAEMHTGQSEDRPQRFCAIRARHAR